MASITVGALAAAFGLIGGFGFVAAAGLVAALILFATWFTASPAVVIHQARWVAPARMAIGGDQPSRRTSQRSRRHPKGCLSQTQPAAQSPSVWCSVTNPP